MAFIHSLLRSAVSRVQTHKNIKNTYSLHVVQKGLIFEVSNHKQLHTKTHLPGLTRTSDQPVTEAATYTIHDKQNRQISIDALSGIRTCDPSHQAAEDIRLRKHGHRDWEILVLGKSKFVPKFN